LIIGKPVKEKRLGISPQRNPKARCFAAAQHDEWQSNFLLDNIPGIRTIINRKSTFDRKTITRTERFRLREGK